MDKSIEVYIKQIIASLKCSEEEKDEIEDEMRDHFYLLVQEYLQEGYSNEEAAQKAIQAFGEGKEIGKGLQKSLSPFYKLVQYSLWIAFFLYIIVLTGELLIIRVIKTIIRGYNQYFFPLDAQEGGPFIIFQKEIFVTNTNFIPFENIYTYILHRDQFDFNIILHNTLGNILIFVPLGIFFSLLISKKSTLLKASMFFLMCSVSIEILQYILRLGQFDIDDVILNTMGGIAGFFIVKSIKINKKLALAIGTAIIFAVSLNFTKHDTQTTKVFEQSDQPNASKGDTYNSEEVEIAENSLIGEGDRSIVVTVDEQEFVEKMPIREGFLSQQEGTTIFFSKSK